MSPLNSPAQNFQGHSATRRHWEPSVAQRGEGEWRAEVDPGTGTTFTEVLDLTPDETIAHVESIRAAYAAAGTASPSERAAMLRALATAIEQDAYDLGELDALTTGKLLGEAVRTVERAPAILRYYASLVERDPFTKELEPIAPGVRQRIDRLPVGVVAVILPWNYPVSQTCVRLAAVLAGGNASIFKGSELAQTPLLAIEKLAQKAGLPPWAFSVVTGGPEVGRRLVEHPAVDGVLFTGGVPTGLEVAATAMRSLKRLVLELGGKTPNVVFKDADLERALTGAVDGAFRNQGQICSAGSLVLVQRPVYDAFVSQLVERTNAIRLGHQLDEGTQMGPLISEGQRGRIEQLVEASRAAGAQVLHGGGQPADSALSDGYFYLPTVLADVPEAAPAATEEIFGPVVVVEPFDDDDEIIARTNGSRFGLASAIWTQDKARAERLRSVLRTGVVWVNCHGPLAYNAPWGGFRMSGLGRILGEDAVFAFTETRQTYEAPSPK